MGIDAKISFTATLTADEANDLAYDLAIRCRMDDHPCITPSRHEPNVWQVAVWDRYFGAGYERGSWPRIRSVLAVLLDWQQRELVSTVFYGGDHSDHPPPFTANDLAEMDGHFAHGDWGYRSSDVLPARSDEPARPLDSYGKPMRICGGGPNVTIYRSLATGEELSVTNPEATTP